MRKDVNDSLTRLVLLKGALQILEKVNLCENEAGK